MPDPMESAAPLVFLSLKHNYTPSDYLPLATFFPPVKATRYEPLKEYSGGGYYPVHIGDMIHNQYKVLQKLGFGATSTVWLVKDVVRDRYCALKILQASVPLDVATREVRILQDLRRRRHRNYPWIWNAVAGQEAFRAASHNSIFPLLYDHFVIRSDNGRHSCYAMEVLGCSLHSVIRHVNRFKLPPILCLTIIMKMAKILRSMHAHNIVHADIHTGNVMFTLQDDKVLSKERIVEIFGTPSIIKVADIDPRRKGRGIPLHLVPVAPLTESQFSFLQNSTIKLIDYGESRRKNIDGLRRLYKIPHNMAPEIMFGEKIDAPTDVWALGCMFFEMIAGYPPFVGWALDDLLADMVLAYSRPLPIRWWNLWMPKDKFFDENGAWISKHEKSPLGDLTFGERLRNVGVANFGEAYWEEHEFVVIEHLLRGMLAIDPAERITAAEIFDYFPDAWKESPPRRVKSYEFRYEKKAPCEDRDSAELCA